MVKITEGDSRPMTLRTGEVVRDRWVFGHLIVAAPVALNLMSSRGAPRGREVPTHPLLQRLPLKPPRRTA